MGCPGDPSFPLWATIPVAANRKPPTNYRPSDALPGTSVYTYASDSGRLVDAHPVWI